jgi:hypothetical protein
MRQQRAVGLAAPVLGLLLLAGCSALNPDPTEVQEVMGRVSGVMEEQARAVQTPLPVGATLTTPTGEGLTVERVGSELAGTTPPEGRRLVVLDVALANPGTEARSYDPQQDFWLSDVTGRRYQPIAVVGLPAEQLAPGAQARGQLAFAVLPNAADLRFGWQALPTTVFVIA